MDMERRISRARVRLSFLMGFSQGVFVFGVADAVEIVGDFADFEHGAGVPGGCSLGCLGGAGFGGRHCFSFGKFCSMKIADG